MSLYSQTSVPYQDQISENSQKNNGPSDVLGYYAYDSDDELQNSIVKVEFEYNQIIVDVINAFIVGLFLSIVGIGILMIETTTTHSPSSGTTSPHIHHNEKAKRRITRYAFAPATA